jgi:hypothetical protein
VFGKHCCPENAKIRFHFVVIDVDVADVFSVAIGKQQRLSFALLTSCRVFLTAGNNNNNNNNNNEVRELQKTAILGTAHILRKVLT